MHERNSWYILLVVLFMGAFVTDRGSCAAAGVRSEPPRTDGANPVTPRETKNPAGAKRISIDGRTLRSLHNQCGPFAVAVIAKFWGLQLTLAEARSLTHYDYRLGTTTGAIREALAALGLQTLAANVTFPVLQEMLNRGIPAVVGYGRNHVAVALPPYRDGRILLVDATMLKSEYVESKTFRQHWDGMAVFARAHNSPDLVETATMVRQAQVRHMMAAALPPLLGALVILGVKGWRWHNRTQRGD